VAFTDSREDEVVSDINMTPLIDVMLVLLIVFMVTLPVIAHAVKLDLPSTTSTPNDTQPAHITVVTTANGALRWDEPPMEESALQARMEQAAAQQPQPEVQLYADRAVRYEVVANVLSTAQRAGLTKIDFVTQPQTQ
jgi:biopolymer transport protein ExbD